MVLKMVNDKIKKQMERQQQEEGNESEEQEDLNILIKHVAKKFYRSENNQDDLDDVSNDSESNTSNKRYCSYY